MTVWRDSNYRPGFAIIRIYFSQLASVRRSDKLSLGNSVSVIRVLNSLPEAEKEADRLNSLPGNPDDVLYEVYHTRIQEIGI